MNFEFATAQRIVFGPGKLAALRDIAPGFGSRALLVTGADAQRAEPVIELLRAAGIAVSAYAARGEPTIAMATDAVARARTDAVELVIGFGGGSAIDLGKAVAALITNPGEPLDYLEVIGRGQALRVAPLPYIAVPTTAGSGAEATRNAVLAAPDAQVKVSLRSPLMLPRVAIVDPQLTHALPRTVSAATGMDALTQLIEPFVSARATPMTDALCRDGIARAAQALPRVCADGTDAHARESMALASLFGGIALANAGLGAVHGFAAPIGGQFSAPHGAVCAQLLPYVWRANVAALRAQSPNHPALARYAEAARLLAGQQADVNAAGDWLLQLRDQLEIPTLRMYGISVDHVDLLAERAAKASSMQANPIALSHTALCDILTSAL
jgi:alcohol dehydrogenase class IV